MINRILALLFIGSLFSLGCERNDEPMMPEEEPTNGEEVEPAPEEEPMEDEDWDDDF